MKLSNLPYRLVELYYEFRGFLTNLKNWLPIMWRINSFDYSSVYVVMENQFRILKKSTDEAYWRCPKQRKKDSRRILVAAELCKRLANDEYLFVGHGIQNYKLNVNLDIVGVRFSLVGKDKEIFRIITNGEQRMKERDKKHLYELMSKHLEDWWT